MKTPRALANNNTLHVVSYNAPSITYATLAGASAKQSKKRSLAAGASSDDDHEDGLVTTPVHCVIKAKTFDIVLGSAKLDFRRAKISAMLVYESSGDEVERKNALEFSAFPAKDGRTVAVELRVNVLSSQLEGALFRAHFAVEPVGGTAATVRTEPIRVVSKKSQLDVGGSKKRSRTTQVATREAVLEMIEKMDEQMTSSQAMMQGVVEQSGAQAALIQSLLARLEAIHGEPGCNTSEIASPSPSCMSVDAAFGALMAALARGGVEGAARLTALGRTLDAPHWQLLAPLFSQGVTMPPPMALDYDVQMTDHRVFLSGSAGNLFGLGGV